MYLYKPDLKFLDSQGIICCVHCMRFSLFFFLSRFSFANIHNSQDNREKGNAFLTSLYHFHSLHRQLDISLAITAAYSPLHIASCRIRTGNI